jgi:Tfp pilus assembly protein PilO
MNAITPWFVSFALFVILAFAVYAAIKTLQKKNQEIRHLKGEVQKQKENMAYLVKHVQELAEIKKDQDKLQEEIQNAKSDDEVADIINAIININNSKLRQ